MTGLADGSSTDGVVNVPQVAEVDAVVIHADGLRVRLAGDLAASVSLRKLEKLVIRVLAVRGEALGPNV